MQTLWWLILGKGGFSDVARLKEKYKNEVSLELMKKFGYKSVMEIPKLEKVVINVGAGEAKDNSKVIDAQYSEEFDKAPMLGNNNGKKRKR